MLTYSLDSDVSNLFYQPEDQYKPSPAAHKENLAWHYPGGEAEDIKDKALLSDKSCNSRKGSSRHEHSWKTINDKSIPAEPDQLVMDWLQDNVRAHDSVSVRDVPVHYSQEDLNEEPVQNCYQWAGKRSYFTRLQSVL